MNHGTREDVLARLAEAIELLNVAHPTRVVVDGAPAAGRTTLADELAVLLRAQGRAVIRATIDEFLFPRSQRYWRGEYSAEGCYFDTHDYNALTRVLLDPLGPDGDRRFQDAVYDSATDTVLSPPVRTAPADSVLIFDGVFLLRPELIDRWELRIFVSATLEKIVDRAVIREHRAPSRADVERRWNERYIPAQQPRQPAWEARTN